MAPASVAARQELTLRESMKNEIHPEYHPVVFVDGEHEILSQSTITSGKTRDIDGVKHYVLDVAISSATHPFWTGTQRMSDIDGRVDRFNKKYGGRVATGKKRT
ncbi:MAG: large subunit ribosomal protein L31 [Bradymonadia bacterium]|jgi:large subunit ribosomal protein L31